MTVAFVAVGTLLTLAPLRRLAALSFRFGLLFGELPFLAFYWLLLWTVSAFWQGDVGSPGGWAVAGLAVLTTAGLAVVVRRGLLARPAAEHALAEGLGAGWRSALDVRPRHRLPLTGHLAALAALTPGAPVFQTGFEDADTSVTAAICLNGYYGNYYGQGADSSPMAYLSAEAPPFFIAHGDRDTVVPVESARLFAASLRSTSANPVVYVELPGAQHAFDLFHSVRFETVVDAVEDFAAWVRSREKTRRT
ncbi:prolyl oligopeptidase family serine peptidase [Sphaerisporangium viridialbum]|uniref:prolyl oligopeptidase family serine peptidase n=1 Tax=Sphaerisporangium viridialbum TaxID=46189 RepID=UPI003C7422B9